MSAWQPTCMTAAEHQDWTAAAEWANATAGVYVPPICHDCTRPFRRAAKRDGTCNRQGAQDTRERVLELRAEGLTWGQIATRMGHGNDKRAAKWASDRARDRSKSTGKRAMGRASLSVVPEAGGSAVLAGGDPLLDRRRANNECQWRRRRGIRIYRSRAEVDELANQILAMREDGLTFDVIDRTLGLTPHYAQQIAVRKRSNAA